MEDILTALSSLLSAAGTGGYKIFFEDEMLEVFPEDLRTRETLEAALKKLAQDGCVDVKYVRGDAFCIAVLKEYRPPEEETVGENQARPSSPGLKKAYLLSALSAFLGAAAGGCVAAVIASVI